MPRRSKNLYGRLRFHSCARSGRYATARWRSRSPLSFLWSSRYSPSGSERFFRLSGGLSMLGQPNKPNYSWWGARLPLPHSLFRSCSVLGRVSSAIETHGWQRSRRSLSCSPIGPAPCSSHSGPSVSSKQSVRIRTLHLDCSISARPSWQEGSARGYLRRSTSARRARGAPSRRIADPRSGTTHPNLSDRSCCRPHARNRYAKPSQWLCALLLA